jgi:hypothetical protein
MVIIVTIKVSLQHLSFYDKIDSAIFFAAEISELFLSWVQFSAGAMREQ